MGLHLYFFFIFPFRQSNGLASRLFLERREAEPGVSASRGFPCDRSASPVMQDVTMLLFTALFFAIAFLYVKACQKLR